MSFRQNLSPLALGLLLAIPASAAENTIPNFGMDSSVGWIAGVPDSDEPIGDDFLPPPEGPGPVVSDKAHPYIDNTFATRTGQPADIPCCRSCQPHSAALGARSTAQSQ